MLLREFVRNKFEDKEVKPNSWNSTFFPSDRDINNHIYAAVKKMKLDQLDQGNLEKLIKIWKDEDPARMFYLRTITKTITKEEKKENVAKSEDVAANEESFLYVHQEKWQRDLMKKYGHDLCFMDATHKTTKYSLPLFFVCVKTNAGYQIVGK